MAIDLNLTDIQSGFLTATAYTANNTLIEQALQDAVNRQGGANNEMLADLDMGLNNIINVNDIDVNSVTSDGVNYTDVLSAFADAAEISANESAASADESSGYADDANQSYLDTKALSEQFRGTYYGALASDPTEDPLGDPVDDGDLYYNTTESSLYVYNGNTESWAPVEDSFTVDADQVFYDNTSSGLSAVNAQEAFDENVEAINQRTIYVGSLSELGGLSLDAGVNVYLSQNGRSGAGTVKSGTAPSDPESGVYVTLANGNYWERDDKHSLTPEMFGAGETADDTAALAAWADFHDANGLRKLSAGKGKTYTVDEFVQPDNTVLDANRSTFKRRVNQQAPVYDVGTKSILRNAIVDGSYDTLGDTGTYNTRTAGIWLGDYSKAIDCEMFNNRSHGGSNRSVGIQLEHTGCKFIRCYSHDNGFDFDPEGAGSADGISFINVHDGRMIDCEADTNARSAFVATTYDLDTMTTNPELSTGCQIIRPKVGGGHGYAGAEINMEKVSQGTIENGNNPDIGITFSGSPDMTVSNVKVRSISGVGADRPTVRDARLGHPSRSHEVLYCNGESINISNVRIKNGTFTDGYSAYLLASDGKGNVHDVSVELCERGIRVDATNISGLSVENATNFEISEGPAGGSFVMSTVSGLVKSGDRKVLRYDENDAPTTGTWRTSDQLWRGFRTAGRPIAWVCSSSGSPGTWDPMPDYV